MSSSSDKPDVDKSAVSSRPTERVLKRSTHVKSMEDPAAECDVTSPNDVTIGGLTVAEGGVVTSTSSGTRHVSESYVSSNSKFAEMSSKTKVAKVSSGSKVSKVSSDTKTTVVSMGSKSHRVASGVEVTKLSSGTKVNSSIKASSNTTLVSGTKVQSDSASSETKFRSDTKVSSESKVSFDAEVSSESAAVERSLTRSRESVKKMSSIHSSMTFNSNTRDKLARSQVEDVGRAEVEDSSRAKFYVPSEDSVSAKSSKKSDSLVTGVSEAINVAAANHQQPQAVTSSRVVKSSCSSMSYQNAEAVQRWMSGVESPLDNKHRSSRSPSQESEQSLGSTDRSSAR